MYQNIHFSRKENTIYLFDDKRGLVTFEYEPYAYKKSALGEHKSIFGDSLEKIYNPSRNQSGLFESDVLAETRTLIDLFADDDSVSTGHVVLNFDIEVNSDGGFGSPDDPWQPITSIAFKDSVSELRRVYVLDVEGAVDDSEYDDSLGKVVVRRFDDEKDLLKEFLREYREIKPTIITGWNIDGFDVPYLYSRLKKVFDQKVAKLLSPINIAYTSPKKQDGTFDTTIAGVSCLDYLKLYKLFTYTELPNYRLGTVGEIEIGMNKVEYDGNLNTLFKTDIKKFIQYNLTDVDIVDGIDKKNKFIELAQSICHICHVPYEFIHFSSKYLEGAILLYLRKKGLVAPDKPMRKNDNVEEDTKFEGAFVKVPQPGIHEWVFDLDLTSLYPSIIMSLNISPETLVGKVYSHIEPAKPKEGGKQGEMIPEHPAWSPEFFASGKLTKVYLTEDACWNEVDDGDDVISIEEFKNKIELNNYSIASNGAMYSNYRVGILSDILDTWFTQRVEYRLLEKDYGAMAKGDLKEDESYYVDKYGYDPNNKQQLKEFLEKHEFYKKRQKVQKILLNSLYGVLGLPIFRFYNLINAEAVTLTGQTIIKTSAKMGNQFYNQILGDDKDYCIYTDTDSTFFSALPIIKKTLPDVDLSDDLQMTKATLDVAETVQSRLNDGYNFMSKKMFNISSNKHRFDIKQEVVAKRAIFITKKRYCQWIINESGLECDDIEVKGLDVVRSSFPKQFKDFMLRVEKSSSGGKVKSGFIVDCLKGKEKSEIDSALLEFKRKVSSNEFDVETIAKNSSIKELSKFEKHFKSQKCVMGNFPKVIIDGKTLAFTQHAKASINFNQFIKHHGLDKKVEPIFNGEKIKYVYLKNNPLALEEIAFRGYHDPDELMEFIKTYVDGKKMYEKEMEKKVFDFYGALGWEYPSESSKVVDEFFSF